MDSSKTTTIAEKKIPTVSYINLIKYRNQFVFAIILLRFKSFSSLNQQQQKQIEHDMDASIASVM